MEYYGFNDAIIGDRIAAKARTIDKIYQTIVPNSGGERPICQTKLRRSAYCVIEKPLQTVNKQSH